MAEDKKQKESSMLLALLLFLGAGGLIFAYLSSEDTKPTRRGPSAAVKTQKYEQLVNRHLMFTNENVEQARQKMALENAQILNKSFNATKPQQAYVPEDRLDLTNDNSAAQMADELGRGSRNEQVWSPHDVVQKELYQEQVLQEQSQAYREEYARQFVENARRGGYKVILSEDLTRVLSVTPIRTPSNGGAGRFELLQ